MKINEMKFRTTDDARRDGLTQLSVWLYDTEDERKVLISMYNQVMKGKNRQAMFVKCGLGSRIALFVNDIT